jgi:hypothetical protein
MIRQPRNFHFAREQDQIGFGGAFMFGHSTANDGGSSFCADTRM